MREKRERTPRNARAVARGLDASGRPNTDAAAIIVAVFAALALADAVVLKAMGLVLSIALVLDATLLRPLVMPATMRLLGEANWWAPRAPRAWAIVSEAVEVEEAPPLAPWAREQV